MTNFRLTSEGFWAIAIIATLFLMLLVLFNGLYTLAESRLTTELELGMENDNGLD